MLVNGGGGGSGSFAIQLAKRLGARVTAVDNAGKLDFMRSLGADEVIDYRRDDATRTGPYDLVLDLVAHRSVFAYRRALARGGRYRCVGGSARALLRVLTVGSVAALVTGRRMGVLAVKLGPAHFQPLAELCVAGAVGIHVDRTYGLEEVPPRSPASARGARSGRSSWRPARRRQAPAGSRRRLETAEIASKSRSAASTGRSLRMATAAMRQSSSDRGVRPFARADR